MIKRTYFYHGKRHNDVSGMPGVAQSYRYFSGFLTLRSWFFEPQFLFDRIIELNMGDASKRSDIEIVSITRL